jgi:hypothetical protein
MGHKWDMNTVSRAGLHARAVGSQHGNDDSPLGALMGIEGAVFVSFGPS